MSSILDPSYGVEDARRERKVKRMVLAGAVAVLVGLIAYFSLRTWSQERVVKEFLTTLQKKDYQNAYKMFGCTQETPCRGYEPDKFNEDWGPPGPYKDPSLFKVENVDYCGSGVIVQLSYPKAENVSLWVERSNNTIGFAPSDRCPGRHLELRGFFRRLFSAG